MALNNTKRSDLAVKYKHVPLPRDSLATGQGMSGMINQSMPMVAMFLKNKFIGWFALIQSFHFYLNNTDEDNEFTRLENRPKKESNPAEQTPAVRVVLSLLGLLVSYMDLVFPQPVPTVKTEVKTESE